MGALFAFRETEPMITYADMQQAYGRYRDARNHYSEWLLEHALSSVKGYESHMGLKGKRAILNGKSHPYVQTGDPYGADGFKPGAYEGVRELGSELQFYMRLVLEEDEKSHQKAWVVLRVSCARQGDSVIYVIEPHDARGVDSVTVRLPASLEPERRTDLYRAMSDVVMQVIDPSPYEI